MANNITKTGLSNSDIVLLKTKGRKMTIALLSFMIFGLLMGFMAKFFFGSNGFLIAVTIIVVIPVIIYLYYYWNFVSNDAKKGYKIVISGRIDDKKMDTSQVKNQSSIGDARFNSYYTKYYFVINGNNILVNEDTFNKFNTDDEVEIHQSASEEFMYSLNPKGQQIKQNDLTPLIVSEMSDEEYKLFLNIRNRLLKQVLTSSFVFGFIAYWVVLFILIFVFLFFFKQNSDLLINFFRWALIPAILLIIWFSTKKTLIALFFDSRQATKQIQTLKIEDKILSNKRLPGRHLPVADENAYCYIKLNKNLYCIDQMLYNSVKIGDMLTLSISLHANIQLNVENVPKNVYYQ
jgi:hypothetical protein